MNDHQPNYATRIRRLRQRFGLTQTRLAKLLGVTPAAVSLWESGQHRPAEESWQLLLRAETLGLHALDADFEHTRATQEPPEDYLVHPASTPHLNFDTDPQVVRLVMHSQRLAYGYLSNPTFGTELAKIEPLPHQRTAVYERMLDQPRLRFLLADDAGAGKTIMVGFCSRNHDTFLTNT